MPRFDQPASDTNPYGYAPGATNHPMMDPRSMKGGWTQAQKAAAAGGPVGATAWNPGTMNIPSGGGGPVGVQSQPDAMPKLMPHIGNPFGGGGGGMPGGIPSPLGGSPSGVGMNASPFFQNNFGGAPPPPQRRRGGGFASLSPNA